MRFDAFHSEIVLPTLGSRVRFRSFHVGIIVDDSGLVQILLDGSPMFPGQKLQSTAFSIITSSDSAMVRQV